MQPQNWITIVGILVGIFTSIFVVYLSEVEIFKDYPTYDVNTESILVENNDHTKLTITNNGIIQAKDAKIHIQSLNNIKIKHSSCLEAKSFINNLDTELKIEFDTFSNNIPCTIDFVENIDIHTITITSIDSPGRIYYPDMELTYKTWNENTIVFSDVNEKKLEDIFSPSNFVPTFVVLEIIFIVPFFIIFLVWQKRIKKQLESKQEELKVVLDRDNIKLKTISEYTDKDKDVVKNKISLMELHDKIRNTTLDLEEIKSKLTRKPVPYFTKKIERLFETWRTFEYDLIRTAKDVNIENTSQPINQIVQELNNKKIVSDDFVKSFDDAYSRRTKTIHGDIKKSFWKDDAPKFITNQIKIVQNLQNMTELTKKIGPKQKFVGQFEYSLNDAKAASVSLEEIGTLAFGSSVMPDRKPLHDLLKQKANESPNVELKGIIDQVNSES